MPHFSRVAVFAKPHENVRQICQKLIDVIVKAGATPVLDSSLEVFFANGCPFEMADAAELGKMAEVAVVLGGDGTMLGAGRLLAPYGVPVIGVNAGRLGFITDIVHEEMEETLLAMLSGHYVRDERPMLRGRLTAADVRAIDDHAAALGIELVPCIETLGHLEQLFRWKAYEPLRDIDGILLAWEDKTYALVEKQPAAHHLVPVHGRRRGE